MKRQKTLASKEGIQLKYNSRSSQKAKVSSKYNTGESRRSLINHKKSVSILSRPNDEPIFDHLIPSYLNVLPATLQPKEVKHKKRRKTIQDVMDIPPIDH